MDSNRKRAHGFRTNGRDERRTHFGRNRQRPVGKYRRGKGERRGIARETWKAEIHSDPGGRRSELRDSAEKREEIGRSVWHEFITSITVAGTNRRSIRKRNDLFRNRWEVRVLDFKCKRSERSVYRGRYRQLLRVKRPRKKNSKNKRRLTRTNERGKKSFPIYLRTRTCLV